MDHITRQAAPAHRQRVPAWIFSVLFHASWISLLAFAVEQAPRGAADEGGRTAGIVLKRTSATGDRYEGEPDLRPSESSSEQDSMNELIAALPGDGAIAESGADLPSIDAPGAGAPSGGGAPDAGQSAGGGTSGSLATGGNTRVRVFGVEGVGNKFVYVFDRSSSMDGPPLAAAKQQLLESLQSLEEIHQFHIIFFNHEVQAFEVPHGGRRLAFANDQNLQHAASFVGGITADGGTDRYAALRKAVALQPDVIFFLTDADDPMAQSELEEIEHANRRAQAAICVIEFGRRETQPSNNFLTELARMSGGQYGYVNAQRLAK